MRRAKKSLGTLGGGNHFIEANRDDDGNIYIVVHSGSRHLGLEVANYYQEEGYKVLNGSTKKDIDSLITELKTQGREREIQKSITALKNTKRTNIPKQLAYVSGELFEHYIHDMKIVQSFTVSEFKNQMNGIYTTSVNKDTLDECPMAYKGMDDIVNNIGDTVNIVDIIKPIYNFKAGGE